MRARIVWRTAQGLTVPVTAVTRISGQYFCFVAEPAGRAGSSRDSSRAGRRAASATTTSCTGGLKAGDRVIVSGIQKLGDGAPVQAQ